VTQLISRSHCIARRYGGWSLEGPQWSGRRRAGGGFHGWFLRLLQQGRQVGLCDAHGLCNLDQDALIEAELVAFLQLIALLPVGVAYVVPRLVAHHDAAVEAVEFEVAILPPLLLPSDVVCEEASEFCHWSGLRCREGR
jgi:hypothetical protein